MKTLMLIRNIEKRKCVAQYFKSEDEAIQEWCTIPLSDKWETFYMKGKERNGHRHQLICSKPDEQGNLYSKYIICFSKKEALSLKDKIEKIDQNYIIQIKKLY